MSIEENPNLVKVNGVESSGHNVGAPSVIKRVMAILNLFHRGRSLISIEEIAETLGMSSASTYRYASEMIQAGLLAKSSKGFRLGPKVIELEYLIRTYDPLISTAQSFMKGLVELTGCDVLLCNFYENHIVNVSHVSGKAPVDILYTKGLPMPLFRGAQAHIVLAHLERRKLRKLYDAGMADPSVAKDVGVIGADWTQFVAALKKIRQCGYYISRGQLDSRVTGFAAPVFGEADEVVSSLVIATHTDAPTLISEDTLIALVVQTAKELSQQIKHVYQERSH